MRTLEDYPDGEWFARHAMAVPYEEKLEIFVELLRVAKQRGSPGISDIMDYLSSDEMELLVTMVGKTFPIDDDELEEALLLYFLSGGKSGNVPRRP
jgi:hypothetical protein